MNHESDKIKGVATTAITNIAASGFYDSEEAKSTLMEILLSVDKVESTNLQMAMGKAITAIATGKTDTDKFTQKQENQDLPVKVVTSVIERAFSPEKGKTKGSGIGLAYLVEIGNISQLPKDSRRVGVERSFFEIGHCFIQSTVGHHILCTPYFVQFPGSENTKEGPHCSKKLMFRSD